MVLVGGMGTGWKPGGGRMSEKSSLLSDNVASSSSDDMSTTAGLKRLCVWGGGFPRTSCVVSSVEKEVREGRSTSRVSLWNLTVNLPSTTFVV